MLYLCVSYLSFSYLPFFSLAHFKGWRIPQCWPVLIWWWVWWQSYHYCKVTRSVACLMNSWRKCCQPACTAIGEYMVLNTEHYISILTIQRNTQGRWILLPWRLPDITYMGHSIQPMNKPPLLLGKLQWIHFKLPWRSLKTPIKPP